MCNLLLILPLVEQMTRFSTVEADCGRGDKGEIRAAAFFNRNILTSLCLYFNMPKAKHEKRTKTPGKPAAGRG